MPPLTPSAGYTLTLRVNLKNLPGTLGRLTTAIGRTGGDLGAVDLVEHRGKIVVRDLTVKCRDEAHSQQIVKAASRVEGVEVRSVSDRTFETHAGGKISVTPKYPLKTRDDLSMAYTPGVGRISRAIADAPERVWDLTIKQNSVAVLTNGTAVLGLGDIGPEAALPVMEGKAMLFKEFADIDAYPICARANTADELVAVARAIAQITNSEQLRGTLQDALREADVFIGLSGPGLVKPEWLSEMTSDAIVFAMANPVPEVMPEEMPENVRIVATGRSDYPNQINNVLVFPGFFRGLLDCRARGFTTAMEIAAARALAEISAREELDEEYIVPSVFDRRVMPAIAEAVRKTAADENMARA